MPQPLLRAVRRANPALADAVDWAGIAASLGADVPVCLRKRPAFVWGVGESIDALADVPRLPCGAGQSVWPACPPIRRRGSLRGSVRRRPRKWAREALPRACARARRFRGCRRRSSTSCAPMATISLCRQAAVVPEIAHVAAALTAAPHCLLAGLSGAGPTCYGIFATPEQAAAAAASLRQSRPIGGLPPPDGWAGS